MRLNPKIALGVAALMLSAAPLAMGRQQAPASRPAASPSGSQLETLVVNGNIEWIELADVASKREGIVAHIEKTIGMETRKGEDIAFLDYTMAELAREKAEMIATDDSAIAEARAQKEYALANMGRAERLNRMIKDAISREEYELKQAELKIASAKLDLEMAKQKQAQKELELAEEAVREHIIESPFDGEVLEVLKYPGEAVQAMEPIIRMAKTDRVRFYGYVPLESAYRLKKGMIVDVTPIVEGVDLPIERKRFRGKIVFIGPELAVNRSSPEVEVKADIINNTGKDLRVNHSAEMTIYLTSDPSKIPPPPDDMLNLPEPATPQPPVLGRRTTGAQAQAGLAQ